MADSKISDLTLVTSTTGDDVFPLVNGGTTKKIKISQLNIPSIAGLATTTYVDTQDALKVDKVAGKQLSDENFLSTEKTKLGTIASGAEVNVNADWNSVSGDSIILNKPTIPSIAGLATTTYVDTQDNLKVDKVAGSRLITTAEGTILGNTSGVNTNDETTATIKSKLSITTLSGSNTGDNATNSQYSGLAASKQDTLTNPIIGTGTTNYLSKFISVNELSDSLIYDNGTNINIGGTSGTALLTVDGSKTAASLIARGTHLTSALVASANNDVLVGLDIAPTFTNGAFTGVENYAQRISGNILQTIGGTGTLFTSNIPAASSFCFHFSTPTATNFCLRIDANNVFLNAPTATGNIFFRIGNSSRGQFTATTGNLIIQNAGTFTDIPSARVQINSTTQGFLPPRMTNAQRVAISSPAIGLMVYCTDAVEGVYVNKSTGWTFIG